MEAFSSLACNPINVEDPFPWNLPRRYLEASDASCTLGIWVCDHSMDNDTHYMTFHGCMIFIRIDACIIVF